MRIPILMLLLLPRLIFAEPVRPQPNIIMVFIDDMGWSDVSCFGGTVKTQNIDRLAAEGIRFTNFYVNSPICSPSRVALTTGQYPQRWRITSYLNNRKDNKKRGMAQWLDPKAPVLARELKKAGYATGHFGKWHMGGQRDVADAPEIADYGFDQSLTNFEGMGPKLLPLTLKPGDKKPGKIWGDAEILGGPVTWMQRSEITAGFVDGALKFVDKAVEEKKPFYLNVWPDDVHSPFFPPLAKWGDNKRALYQGVLDAMDEQLARLFDRVREDAALRENTMIVFCSDNGHEAGAGKGDPLRGAKTWLYEGGIRSPLIVWAPGLIDSSLAGTTNDESVFAAIDLNRSFYEIAGIEPPEKLDGEDVSEALLGRSKVSRKAPVFWRRPPDRPGFGHGMNEDNPDLAMRDGKWKFLINYDGSDAQLYDLNVDISESRNLADAQPDIVTKMKLAVSEWNARMPKDAGDAGFNAGIIDSGHFVNPIGEGADPWVIRDPCGERYLWCFSDGNRGIVVHTSKNLTSLGEKHVVWRAPEDGPYSREIWAPELHFLDGKWVIYFAASDGKNENHLAYALQSKTDDPLGDYDLHGPLMTGDGGDPIWAIDMTPLEFEGKRYALWSGWDAAGSDRQYLYIAPMKSPTELAGKRVRICGNDDFRWEFTEDGGDGRGLNEGPQILKTGKRTFVIYSCGASWLPNYKLGMLELSGDDPLDPASWRKKKNPVFEGTEETFGVGHSCFEKSPDGSEWWHVFHAKRDRNPGWRRAVFVQPMKIGKKGEPIFGKPLSAGDVIPRPAGELLSKLQIPYRSDLKSGFSFFGHHQYAELTEEGLLLGREPAVPINAYRCGEKIVLDAAAPDDFRAAVTIDFEGNRMGRGAGLLFRVTGASVGYDAQRGYFAGVKPSQDAVLLGKMDGEGWQEMARAEVKIDVSKKQRLEVSAVGAELKIKLNDEEVLSHNDASYQSGTVGLRVVDIPVVFSDFVVTNPNHK